MKIIAYVANSYFYFGTQIPLLSELCEILTVPLFEILKNKLGKNTTPEEFALFWDSIMSKDKYDVLWAYNRPDEVTIAKCMEYNVTIMVQEYFGHYPYNICGLLPLNCDFEKRYKDKVPILNEKKEFDEKPLKITYSLSVAIFDEDSNISNIIGKYKGKDEFLDIYWRGNPCMEDYLTLVKILVDVCFASNELKDSQICVRPHPRYPEKFKDVIDYVEKLNDPRVVLDYSDIKDSLENTDIAICANSSYGFDALRAGCEVITFDGKAYYAHSQLTQSPKNPEELKISLLNAVRKIRENRKTGKSFLPFLLEDLEGPLANPCLFPYDVNKLMSAFEYGIAFPRLDIR